MLFRSAALYHFVDDWQPGVMDQTDLLTPGRMAFVFFSPAASMRVARNKPKDWFATTAGGMMQGPAMAKRVIREHKKRTRNAVGSEHSSGAKTRGRRGTRKHLGRVFAVNPTGGGANYIDPDEPSPPGRPSTLSAARSTPAPSAIPSTSAVRTCRDP